MAIPLPRGVTCVTPHPDSYVTQRVAEIARDDEFPPPLTKRVTCMGDIP
jgi:hypothetical protein